MNTGQMKRNVQLWMPLLFLIGLGAGGGFINGLLGTGGGIFLVYTLRWYSERHAQDGRGILGTRDVYAGALAVMLPISVFSATHYARAGALDLSSFAPLLLPSVVGGVLGGILLDKLRIDLLRRLFALLVLCSGILMILR